MKPGDVALVQDPVHGGRVMIHVAEEGGACWHGVVDDGSLRCLAADAALNARPLLLIDPENREQVERFREIASKWSDRVLYSDMREEGDLTDLDAMQAAFREFLEPPKPPEPERLAALVEDANGVKYVSVADPLDGWMATRRWQQIGGEINTVRNFGWSDLDVVRVLSDGWVEES